jgi:hypothetical protein
MLSLVALPAPALAAKAVSVAWGKTGVSFDQYRRDAVDCGRAGYYLDVSGTDAARAFKWGSRQLEASENRVADILTTAITSARIVEVTQPEKRMKDVGALLQATVNGCLVERGYTPFRLTKAQQSRLRRLHMGSPERHAYLYGLGTDENVLRSQAIPVVIKDSAADLVPAASRWN